MGHLKGDSWTLTRFDCSPDIVTDVGRKFVLGVATMQDLEVQSAFGSESHIAYIVI